MRVPADLSMNITDQAKGKKAFHKSQFESKLSVGLINHVYKYSAGIPGTFS
jgi:hypothetical protein